MEAFDHRPDERVHDSPALASFADGGDHLIAVLKAIAHRSSGSCAQKLVSATRSGGYARYRLHDLELRDLVRFAEAYSSASER